MFKYNMCVFVRNNLQTYIWYIYIYIHIRIYLYTNMTIYIYVCVCKQNVAAIHKILLHRACKSSNVHPKWFATSWSILMTNNCQYIYIYVELGFLTSKNMMPITEANTLIGTHPSVKRRKFVSSRRRRPSSWTCFFQIYIYIYLFIYLYQSSIFSREWW